MSSIICQFCNTRVVPELLATAVEPTQMNVFDHVDRFEYSTYKCPECGEIFFSIKSNLIDPLTLSIITEETIYPSVFQPHHYQNTIASISPSFIEIYNQALNAEMLKLDKIIGSGYRLAFEYLIKDFAIYLNPENSEEITKDNSLSNVIFNRIPNEIHFDEIKDLSKRTWWLGCDYSHYYQNYSNLDIDDLKNCIEIVVNEIDYFIRKKELKSKIIKL